MCVVRCCALLWWYRAVLCCCGCGCGCGQEDSVAPGQLLFMSTPVLGVRCLGVASGVLVLDSACCCVSVLSAMLGQQIPFMRQSMVPLCASGHSCSVLCAAEEYKIFFFGPLLMLPSSSQCLVCSGYTGCVSPGGILDEFSHVSYMKADVGS